MDYRECIEENCMTELADELALEDAGLTEAPLSEVILTCPACSSRAWYVQADGVLCCPNCSFQPSDMHVDIRVGAPH